MAVFLVTTNGVDVPLPDLGIVISHPTIDRDLLLEYSAGDLSTSNYLTLAITTNALVLKLQDEYYNLYIVDPTEYFAGLAAENQFNRAEEEEYVTEIELSAGYLDTLINVAATSLSITSTAALTKNIYVSTGSKFQKWKLFTGDRVVITGGPASGIYTVNIVIDQNQFTVIEPISNTSGVGTLSLYHPTGAAQIGIDNSNFAIISGSNLQQVLDSIDDSLTIGTGLTESGHQLLDTLAHNLDENYEITRPTNFEGVFSGVNINQPGSGPLIRSSQSWTHNGDGIITGYIIKQYNGSGTLVETLTVSVDPLTGKHTVIKT